jgi:Protein of unknown function (DUF664)
MDDALQVVSEMNENMWRRFKNALEDLGEEELHWQPLPQANTINLIVRHLRIEAQWHLDGLERGEPMPTIAVSAPQEMIDAVSTDFEDNFKKLEDLYTRFVEMLRKASLVTLQQLRQRPTAKRMRRKDTRICWDTTRHTSCDALRADSNDQQLVPQDARRAGPVFPRQPDVCQIECASMPATKPVTAFGSPCNSRRARRTQKLVSVDRRSCG